MNTSFQNLLLSIVVTIFSSQLVFGQTYATGPTEIGFATAYDPKTNTTYLSSAVQISLNEKNDFNSFSGRLSSDDCFYIRWSRRVREVADDYNPDTRYSFVSTGNVRSFTTKDQAEAYKDSYEDSIRRKGGKVRRVSISN